MREGLVLSLFPGIGILDKAFEEEGFCVVRGPDLLWGGDVRRFHPPAGKFDGVIGGPPCQAFSRLVHIVKAKGQTPKPNLIPEFERIVEAAHPTWFLMENVSEAPEPRVRGYYHKRHVLTDAHVGGATSRKRAFTFGREQEDCRLWIEWSPLHTTQPERAVVAQSSKEGAIAKSQQELRDGISPRLRRQASALPGQMPRRSVAHCAQLQGLPADFLEGSPFTTAGKYLVIGNGVPLPMGRAIAKAVRRALGHADQRDQRESAPEAAR